MSWWSHSLASWVCLLFGIVLFLLHYITNIQHVFVGFFNVFYMFCANKLKCFFILHAEAQRLFVVNWWRQNSCTQRLFLLLLVSLVDVPDYKSLFIIWTRGQQSSTACCQTNCVLGDLFISRVLYIRTLTPVPTSMRPSVWRRLFNAQSAQINNISSANYTLCFMICFIWLLSSSLDILKSET